MLNYLQKIIRRKNVREKAYSLNNATAKKILELMLLSRAADKREVILFKQGKAHVQVSSAGHEALMAVTMQLHIEDYLYPYYRGRHNMLAKGLELVNIARDYLAKGTSTSQGRSMSMHCGSAKLHVFPSAAPTASQCLPAVGTAWGQKLARNGAITVCSIGDGATREGEFYEAVCFAIEQQLPVIFLVEDNHYAISTPTKNLLPFHLNVFTSELYKKLDGSDVFTVYQEAQQAIERARSGQGPTILWCEVDRLDAHTGSEDHALYRTSAELKNLRDPIELFVNKLLQHGILTQGEFAIMQQAVEEKVQFAYKQAQQDPEPEIDDVKKYLYHLPVDHLPLPKVVQQEARMTMVEAINKILELGLQTWDKVLLFGQDILDPKGGVFGFTKGLSSQYPERVFNAPIVEATIIGSAIGLAATGYKPVFEIQFIDFITPGFDQLVTNVASLNWRSCGAWKCPLVLYAPYGAYLPAGGLWHSQSNEGWWTHIPGLRVAIPSNPEDLLGLFWAAFQDSDPSIILIPKHLFRIKMPVTQPSVIPFGKARLVQEGNDVTVISWGNTVELAQKAAEKVIQQGISVEIIDLRTLVPCDWHTIQQSVAKTKRLVVVHEDNKTSG